MLGGQDATVHEHRFGNVVCVVAGDDMVDVEHRGAAVQGLSAEYAAECAVVLFPDFGDDGVHRPSVELVVGQDFERHVVLLLVSFYGLRQSQVREK